MEWMVSEEGFLVELVERLWGLFQLVVVMLIQMVV